jgi:hypothetical protein
VKKSLLTALTLALVIGGATAVFAAVDNPTAPTATSTTVEDISGPCDEAEHANDPRCVGGNDRDHDARGHRGHGDDDEAHDARIGEDVSGPCDEAEHANDPRCAPGAPTGQLGNDEDDDDDREAVDDDLGEADNSGPGSISSGHSGEADDDGGESGHSGPGGGGEGDDD